MWLAFGLKLIRYGVLWNTNDVDANHPLEVFSAFDDVRGEEADRVARHRPSTGLTRFVGCLLFPFCLVVSVVFTLVLGHRGILQAVTLPVRGMYPCIFLL